MTKKNGEVGKPGRPLGSLDKSKRKKSPHRVVVPVLEAGKMTVERSELTGAALTNELVQHERVLQELCHIAYLDPAELFDGEGNLLPIDQMPERVRRTIGGIDVTYKDATKYTPASKTIRIKIIDKLEALKLLGMYLRMFQERPVVPDDQDLFLGHDEIVKLIEAQRQSVKFFQYIDQRSLESARPGEET